jgi:hypothetical protein
MWKRWIDFSCARYAHVSLLTLTFVGLLSSGIVALHWQTIIWRYQTCYKHVIALIDPTKTFKSTRIVVTKLDFNTSKSIKNTIKVQHIMIYLSSLYQTTIAQCIKLQSCLQLSAYIHAITQWDMYRLSWICIQLPTPDIFVLMFFGARYIQALD